MSGLQTYLGGFYKEHVLHGGHKRDAGKSFKEAMASDKDLKNEASKRLDELNALNDLTGGNLAKRCYVSHIQRIALKEALDG